MKPATRLIDVAKEVGMSRAAVARVLLGTGEGRIRVSEAAKERIRVAAKKLNYRPNIAAQQLKGKGSKTLAVIALDSSPRVMVERIYAMERRAWHYGYDLFLYRTPYLMGKDVDLFLDRLRNRDVEGLIVLDCISEAQRQSRSNQIFEDYKAVFHGYAICDDDHGIAPDLDAGTKIAVQHFVDQGRRRIGLATFNDYDERIAPWRETLVEAGLSTSDRLCYFHAPADGERLKIDVALAKAIVQSLVVEAEADAIVLENDFWAARVLNECQSRGIQVPQDVALIGYNNLDFTEFTSPSLSTIDERNEVIGKELVDQVLGLIKGQASNPTVKTVKPSLLARDSS
jgi:DNA-binding LacI/PurR family transcriptional regulator